MKVKAEKKELHIRPMIHQLTHIAFSAHPPGFYGANQLGPQKDNVCFKKLFLPCFYLCYQSGTHFFQERIFYKYFKPTYI